MTLSLVDTASPQVRAFVGLLEQLQTVAAATATRLEASVAAIASVGTAAQAALGQVAAIGAAAQASAAQVTEFGMAGAAAAGRMSGIGTASRAAATGMAEAGVAAQAAGAQIGGIGTQAQTAVAHTNTLANTLKGMAQIWAAFKIEGGLKASVQDAIEFQNTTTRLQGMNLGPTGTQGMISAATRASSEVPQFSRNEMLEMAIDLRNAMGTAEHAIEMLPEFARAAFNMRMGTPRGQIFDDRSMLQVAKILEQLGVTLDPEKMRAALDAVTKIYVGTQGRVNPQQLLGNIQYLGPLARSMELPFLTTFAAMIEQQRSLGGQGGMVGTQLTTLMNAVFGRGDASSIAERTRLGLVDPSKIVWTNQGNVNLQKSDKTAAGLAEFLSNPNTWAQTFLKPAIERAGVNIDKAKAGDQTEIGKVMAELLRLLKDRTAARAASTMLLGEPLIAKDTANINQVLSNQELYTLNLKTATAALDAFTAQNKNLGIVLGNTVLPALTTVMNGFSALSQAAGRVFEGAPIIAQVAVITGVLGSIGLGLIGVINIMGKFGLATTGMVATLTTAGAFLLRFAGIFGATILAMTLIDLLLEWEVDGRKVSDWLSGWMGDLVTTVKNGWLRMKEFFGLISSDAMQSAIDANNAARMIAGLPGKGEKVGAMVPGRESGGSIRSAAFSPSDVAAIQAAQAAGKQPYGPPGALFDQADRPGARVRGGRGGAYNEAADLAKQDRRLDEEERRQSLKTLDLMYKDGQISVDAYYTAVETKSREAAAQEISDIQRRIDAINAQKKLTPADQKTLTTLETDKALVNLRLQGTLEDAEINRKKAIADLDRRAVDIQRELMSVTGHKREAELLHLQEQIDAKTRIEVLNGRMTQTEADAFKAQAVASLKYNQDLEQVTRLQEKQRLSDEETNNLVKAGQLTEEEAARQRHDHATQAATDMQAIIVFLQQWADASGDPKLQFAVQQLRVQTKGVLTELGPDAVAARNVMDGAFRGLFNNLILGTKSIKSAFADFFKSLAQGFADIASKQLSGQVMKALFGGEGGGIGSIFGGGSGFGGLFSGFGNLFGGGGGGAGTFATPFGFDSVAGPFDMFGIGGFATGTDFVPRDMLAMVHKGEKITPAEFNKPGMAGGINYSPTFVIGNNVDTRSQAQIAAKAYQGAQRHFSRIR